MWRKTCSLLLKIMGWTVDDKQPAPEDKVIILGAPHTSFWDFVVAYLFYCSIGGHASCMVKKDLFWGPLGWILRKLWAIPVDRKNSTSLILSIVHAMNSQKRLHLAIAPEGTRKPVRRWKTGFHTIAKETGATVYLGYFDWGTKHVGLGKKFEISNDAKADMAKIQEIYESMHLVGKHPKGYVTH